jgi:SAM-dependent MidA family methyltransferase
MTESLPLPQSAEGSDPRILEEIRLRIAQDGPLSFAEFMGVALYHPRWGYYARPEDPIGAAEERDYYTAPSRHPAFGALLGRQIAECLEGLGGEGGGWVEIGPGSGDLAASLLEQLGQRGLGPDSGVPSTLVELSPHRRLAQQHQLASRSLERGVSWVAPEEWIEAAGVIRGCVIANEILDAMPVHRLVFRGGRFHEILVDWDAAPVEVARPARDELADLARRRCFRPVEGQQIEISLAAREWMNRVAARLERGYVFLFDYGHLAPEMASPRHRHGTLLAYHRHLANQEYLSRIGRQDLTAHVDFSMILEVAASHGLWARGPVPQGRFLLALGALDWLDDSVEDTSLERYRDRKALQSLFLPGGMGESHQVVVLGTPGLDSDLTGLRPPERWPVPASARA